MVVENKPKQGEILPDLLKNYKKHKSLTWNGMKENNNTEEK